MGLGRKIAIGVGGLFGVVLLAAGGGYGWASSTATSKLSTTYDVHRVDFPIPFPLTEDELATLRTERVASGADRNDPLASVDLAAVATERAVGRGKHLVATFYACVECHGQNFGGGVMVDDPAMGKILGPNLTTGKGSRTTTYTAADWDRMVRHGVKPTGAGSPMPSRDFFLMSDRELSDVVAYIRSLPPVDNEVPAVALGPIGKMLIATGQLPLSADIHPTAHAITHAAMPPATAPDATYGKHLAQTCSGCHGALFAGGPIVGGPPSWPPAANLTPTGLAGWSFDDFRRALLEAKSKDGRALREPMSLMTKYGKSMSEVELQALWSYLQTLPPQPTPAK